MLPPEAQLLQQYLRAAHWNVTAVAKQLGVARMTLYRRMKRWGITAPNQHGGETGSSIHSRGDFAAHWPRVDPKRR